jgi:GNAT superfamily N-acetyltransferase
LQRRGAAGVTRRIDVAVTYLAMTDPGKLRPGGHQPSGVRLERASQAEAGAWAREGYHSVGGPWLWTDRIHLDDAEWQAIIEAEQGEIWQARDADGLVGYFHLARNGDDVDIRYFGLVERCIGRGIGGWLLTRAVERCWALGPARVTLNTCTLDGPAALPNYLKRGFSVLREEHRVKEL